MMHRTKFAIAIMFAIVVIFLGFVVVTAAGAEEVKAEGPQVSVTGYLQETWHETSGLNNDRTRLKFVVEGDGPCSVAAEFDISGASRSSRELRESNWLQQLWGTCQLGKTQLKFGRIFPESGYSTFWPGGIITAKYPGMYPWEGFYAYGLSAKRPISKNWVISGTLSGQSDLQFDQGGQFDRLEVAGRAVRSLESGRVGFTTQASEDFFHTGVDFRRQFGDTRLDGGVFYSDSDSTPISAFVQLERDLTESLALHTLLEESVNGDEVVITGIGVRVGDFYFVGDYEMNFDLDEGSFLAGVRINW